MSVSASFKDQLSPEIVENINKLYDKIVTDSEFEVMFFNYQRQNKMGMDTFLKILEFMTHKATAKKLRKESFKTLDIGYVTDTTSYRITLNGMDTIQKYTQKYNGRKNHVVYKTLVALLDQDPNITIIKKEKDRSNVIDIDDFDIRFRLSSESKVTKEDIELLSNLDEKARNNIIYRYKQRISVFLDETLAIDLTDVKTSKRFAIGSITNAISNYELEIDYSPKGKSNKSQLDNIFKEINILLKVLQQSNFIVSKTTQLNVLNAYNELLGIKTHQTSLDSRQAISLAVQHVVDQLPNKYAVTDKADGDRCFLFIHNKVVYLITNLLVVKSTGIEIKDNIYDNTLLDGELIWIRSKGRYLFMVFDCLFKSSNDVRQSVSLLDRIKQADDVILNCFMGNKYKSKPIAEYNEAFDVNKIMDFHSSQVKTFIDNLNTDLDIDKQYTLIRRKYFIPVYGGYGNEIFKYSVLLWNKFTKDPSIKCPYTLDGLIYHPLDQKYIASAKDSKFFEYKWKPSDKNSIDFYVQYERSRDTNKIVTIYDNSKDEDEQLHNKPYKVLNLMVGKKIKDTEQPVLFEPEKDSVKSSAYIFLMDKEARDMEGNIIQDNTVVEFYYNNDPNIPDKHRWVPMRTRYDKTESVQRYGTKYGNYSTTAERVWQTIKNPVLMNDFEILSKDGMYNKQIDVLRGKIDHSIILSERKENIYYQQKTNIAPAMRAWHNWIKSILIYTYVNSKYTDHEITVLDIACGRGGDLAKFYYGNIKQYVGLDIDNNGLISPVDGAISRYNNSRKKYPNFPPCAFIQADAGVLFNYDNQNTALGGMTDINKRMILQHLNGKKQYERINCQFAVHYFLENETSWNNFLQNVNDYLAPSGFIIFTTFDADKIIELLENSDKYTANYTNKDGQQQIFFEMLKRYDGIKPGDDIGLGVTIDLYNSIYSSEGDYKPEYLVQQKFFVDQLKRHCDLELVDTDMFENQYNMTKPFFNDVYKSESDPRTRKFMEDVSKFFNEKTEINTASYKLSKLYRYYVFRKSDKGYTTTTSDNKKQKGGHVNEYIVFDQIRKHMNPKQYVYKNIPSENGYSLMEAIHDVLMNDRIIPNISVDNFWTDMNCSLVMDNGLNDDVVHDICSKLIIKHQIKKEIETVLDGISVMVLKRDCDGQITSELYGNSNDVILLYYVDDKYCPIYRLARNKQYNGIFDGNTKLIQILNGY